MNEIRGIFRGQRWDLLYDKRKIKKKGEIEICEIYKHCYKKKRVGVRSYPTPKVRGSS